MKVLLPLQGAIVGSSIYSTMGSIGMVGSFGGIGLGLGSITTLGFIGGSALWGGIHALNTQDTSAVVATGVGFMGGIATYNTIGGIGVAIGGTAFGIGCTTMALSGGILGLGIYGLAKMFRDTNSYREAFGYTYSRLEARVSDLEAYNEAMAEVDPTLADMAREHRWQDIEIGYELADLKKKLGSNIDYGRLNKLKMLKARREKLMNQLRQTFSSYKRFNLLNEIDDVEKQIKENRLFP